MNFLSALALEVFIFFAVHFAVHWTLSALFPRPVDFVPAPVNPYISLLLFAGKIGVLMFMTF
jgi:hypothetical protein